MIESNVAQTRAGVIPDSIEMGVGAWAWGDRLMWSYGGEYGEAEVRGAFEASMAAGIRLVDTAEVYGRGTSERLLGTFTRESGSRPYIATKFAPLPWRLTRRQLVAALRGSLRRLGLPSVDLYQIHWPMPLPAVETWADALADAVDHGLTRAVGVSNYNAALTRRMHAALARRGVPLASNQVEYSLIRRTIETDGTFDACRELGVRVIAYSPLGLGLLTGKYGPDNPPPAARAVRARGLLPRLPPLVALLREFGERRGKTPAQVALNWTICQGTLPIPGAKNAGQAEQNAGALGWRLTDDELHALDALSLQVAG